MARPKKQQPQVIDEEQLAAPPEVTSHEELQVTHQIEDLNGDSAALSNDDAPLDEVNAATPVVSVITPQMVKFESLRVIPLLIDAIRFLLSKKPVTPTAREIITKRLESGTILLDAVKRQDV
jgi:hypothetical protein